MNDLGNFLPPFLPQNVPHSTFTLSYLGDAWYELWCRQLVLFLLKKPDLVHEKVTRLVCCQAQAEVAQRLESLLDEEEQRVYRRGKNRKVVSCPKNATIKEYRAATGFECLIGHWYLTNNTTRFTALMQNQPIWSLIQHKLLSDKTISVYFDK